MYRKCGDHIIEVYIMYVSIYVCISIYSICCYKCLYVPTQPMQSGMELVKKFICFLSIVLYLSLLDKAIFRKTNKCRIVRDTFEYFQL